MTDTAKEILASAFDVACGDVPGDASIANFAPWDSLGHLKVIAAIETWLGRELETDEMLAVMDIHSISELLNGSARH